MYKNSYFCCENISCPVPVRWKRVFMFVLPVISTFCISTFFFTQNTNAIAKQSTLSMTVNNGNPTISITPTSSGAFGKSGDTTISINTDNYTGYTFKIATYDSSSASDGYGNNIQSISPTITEDTFRNDSTYNNKWGYKPSQYISNSGGVNTVVINTQYYLPAPTTLGDAIDITNSANSVDKDYTVSFATKADLNMPAGTYNYAYVLRVVANPIVFNITYDDSTDETVYNMPTPNPHPVNIDGGIATADSYVTLSNSSPTRNGYTFSGWCSVATTFNSTTYNYDCGGTTYAASATYGIDQTAGENITLYAVWTANSYTIRFNSNGGDPVGDWTRKHGQPYGTLPTPTKPDVVLEGWYSDSSLLQRVYSYTLASGDVTLFAKWTTSTFPTVWSQEGACIFHGSTGGNITGSECQDYANKQFIDTGIALYSSTNAALDYEIHFHIDHYSPSEQTSGEDQQTFVNDKLSSSAGDGTSPGIVFRRAQDDLSISSRMNTTSKSDSVSYVGVEDVRIFRIDGTIYYSINNSGLISVQNVSSFNQYFDLTTWFGAYPDNVNCVVNCTAAKRFLTATLSNMYIKLGDLPSSDVLTIGFQANGGTASAAQYTVIKGEKIGALPTASKTNSIFRGWFDAPSNGDLVLPNWEPQSSTTYYAYWYDDLSTATIEPSVSISPSDTHTITISASNIIEPYTFVSTDPTVATVDSSGVITGVSDGTTTITVTGTESGIARTVNVIVASSLCTAHFEEEGGSSVSDQAVGCGTTLSSIPFSIYAGYTLEGWYTGQNGTGFKLLSSTTIDDTNITYYAYWVASNYVCAIATYQHTETCDRTSAGCFAAGYTANGSMHTTTITYGNLVSSSSMTLGDAYTCDINYDRTFDEENERFYYVGMNGQNAVLVHSKSIYNSDYTYDDAVNTLPDSSTWSNPNLVTFANNKVARFMTRSEAIANCGGSSNLGHNGNCVYLMEASNFSTTSRRDGIWLTIENETKYRIQTSSTSITSKTTANTPRATIEVPIEYVERGTGQVYIISFNTHGGTSAAAISVNDGDTFASLPTSTKEHYVFVGWFTEESGGTQIYNSDYPTTSRTYHAHWVKDVSLAVIDDDSLDLRVGDTQTIDVTNSSELEDYTFASDDTSVATVNQTTGLVTAVGVGNATITMIGTESHEYQTISVSVTAVPTTYHDVTFVTNGGSAVNTMPVLDDTPIGALPTTSKTGYRFFGWYTDDSTFYNEVTPNTVINSDLIVYARFIEDNSMFPIEFAMVDACTFNGSNHVTGLGCEANYGSYDHIDTGVQLFTSTNFSKDFEVGFTIVSYNPNTYNANTNPDGQKENQATFVNSKKENGSEYYPGFVVRRENPYIQITEKFNNVQASYSTINPNTTKRIVVRKRGNKIYYSINDGTFVELQDITNDVQYFDTYVWFGASAASNGTSSMRQLVGTLTDMYIKQGTFTEGGSYLLNFDGGGADISYTSKSIVVGESITSFPTLNRPNYTFEGWYTAPTGGTEVTTSYVPDGTYLNFYARWSFTPSSTVVSFDTSNDALVDYYDTITGYSSSVSQFTLDSQTINNSYWGVAENSFWSDMRNVFEDNGCMIPSYHDSELLWANGPNDCSKPKGYNTGVGGAVDVYLYDKVNETVGLQVAYTKSSNGYIYNMIPGQAYYWVDANDSSVYGYVEATAEGNRRMIDAGNVRNVRDLGGLLADTDGDETTDSIVNYGMLFRGERIWSSQANVTELTNLGVTKELDLRESNETGGDATISTYEMDTVIHYAFEYTNPASSEYNKMREAVYDTMYDVVHNHKNIYFHCRVGADRTGSLAYVLEGLLGVSDEQRYEDYELTFLSGLTDRTRYYKEKTSSSLANKAKKFVYMMSYLPTTQSIVSWWEAGSTNLADDRALVAAFKSAMTTALP